jgi:hypothetical protein
MHLLFIPEVIYEYGDPWWNDTDRGKLINSVKNLSQCHFVHRKSHTTDPGFHGERSATDRLRHGMNEKPHKVGSQDSTLH